MAGKNTYWWKLNDLVALNCLGLFKDLVGDVLRSRSTVGDVVFDAKVSVGPTRVVTCREENTASSFIFPNDVGSGGSRKDPVFPDDEFLDAIGRSDLQDDLNGVMAEETSVSTNDQSRAFGIDRAERRLYKVLRVVLFSVDQQ
jgi:hypothetical protein